MMLHAKLGPSDAERWLDCPASISMDQYFPDESSFEAREGTAAHELAAIEAKYAFQQITEFELFDQRDAWRLANTEFDQKEISLHVDKYVAHLVERFAGAKLVLIETQVFTPLKDVWGTADAIGIFDEYIDVVDLKYGQGVEVDAYNNPQTKLYGVGALVLCEDLQMAGLLDKIPETVRVAIYQPRRGNFGTEETSTWDLLKWFFDVVEPAVQKVYLPDPEFGPSARACRWCPAAGQCTAQKDMVLNNAFAAPGLMSPEDIGEALRRVPEVKAWLATVEQVALKKAWEEGVPIPGWKVSRSNGSRMISDHAEAIQTLIDAGYTAEQVATFKAKGIGDLEKLLKPSGRNIHDVLGDLVVRRQGTVSLVPEDDRRPAIDRNTDAALVFSAVEGTE